MSDNGFGVRKSSWGSGSEPARRDGAADPFAGEGSTDPLPTPQTDDMHWAVVKAGYGTELDLDVFGGDGPAVPDVKASDDGYDRPAVPETLPPLAPAEAADGDLVPFTGHDSAPADDGAAADTEVTDTEVTDTEVTDIVVAADAPTQPQLWPLAASSNPFAMGLTPTVDLAHRDEAAPPATSPHPETSDLAAATRRQPLPGLHDTQPAGGGGDTQPPADSPPADRLPIGQALDVADTGPDLSDLFGDDAPVEAPHPQSAPILRVAVKLTAAQKSGMKDLIGLASSGDPALQSVVANLEITQDPQRDQAQFASYERVVTPLLHSKNIRIGNPADYPIIMQAAYDHLLGLGPLGPLWRDPDISEIMVSGPYQVTAERNGILHRTDVVFDDLDQLHDIGRRISTKVDDRGVSRRNCLVTVQLERARVQLAWPPVARSGGNMAIRKHRTNLSLSALLARKALSADMAAFLSDAVLARATLLVAGGTSTGKTTYLNVASGFIPDTERVLVLEDAAELELTNSFTEYYLTKEKASADDTVVIGYDQLLEAALRMNPDRIIVGEIRGPAGAAAVLEAASTGHEGTMSTIHAETPTEALDRFVDKVRTHSGAPDDVVRKRVLGTFDVVVQVAKNQATGVRFVSDISVVDDGGGMNRLFAGRVDVTKTADGTELVGTPKFTRVEPLSPDTRVARRMANAGIGTAAWEHPVD